MAALNQPKYRSMVDKALKSTGGIPSQQPRLTKPRTSNPPKPTGAALKAPSDMDAVETLQLQLAQARAEKEENAYGSRGQTDSDPEADRDRYRTKLIDAPTSIKKGKLKPGKIRPGNVKSLGQSNHLGRSNPASPALSGITSPSLGPVNTAKQQALEKTKQQRFPIIHELAVKERTFDELFSEWDEGSEEEFQTALRKVAEFNDTLQKWTLYKMYWKELDVFKYPYKKDEERQKAIDNAVKQYDRMRLGVSDPLWQKLLPKSERDKGICLSKLAATIAKGPQPPAPKINVQKADGSSTNTSGDSEKDDSSQGKKTKGGEPMSRSNSAKSKKTTDSSQAQAKRLLSNAKKPAPAKASPKASPKPSPTKSTTAGGKTSTGKGGRILSKEFVSDSDSESEEAPLAKTVPKPKVAPKMAPKAAPERPAEKPKALEKPKPAPKMAAAKPVARAVPSVKDTINAQVASKPARPVKRARDDDDDDDSSSSGTPLSKRFKPKEPAAKMSSTAAKHRASDSSQGNSQNSARGTSSGASMAKSKNTSPVKSSPLASSPPTNASDLDPADERDTIVARKRKMDADAHDSYETAAAASAAKRQRLSPKVLQKANRFKKFYASYEALHKEIVALEHPPAEKVTDLLDMRERLQEWKNEIYNEVPPEH